MHGFFAFAFASSDHSHLPFAIPGLLALALAIPALPGFLTHFGCHDVLVLYWSLVAHAFSGSLCPTSAALLSSRSSRSSLVALTFSGSLCHPRCPPYPHAHPVRRSLLVSDLTVFSFSRSSRSSLGRSYIFRLPVLNFGRPLVFQILAFVLGRSPDPRTRPCSFFLTSSSGPKQEEVETIKIIKKYEVRLNRDRN